MSFFDRIKGNGRSRTDAEATHSASAASGAPLFDELSPTVNPNEATARLGQSTLSPPHSRLDGQDSSIISEAAPSELAPEFSDSRPGGLAGDARAFSSGLPVVGGWPIAKQQRAMLILFAVGLVGLLGTAFLALTASNRGTAQVGAVGQATTQSQRLAKSVSQALVGNATAFPEVTESIGVLTRNVRSLKTGDGDVAAAPGSLQGQVDALLPLVDRA
jgi:twitching motility protein PilJ